LGLSDRFKGFGFVALLLLSPPFSVTLQLHEWIFNRILFKNGSLPKHMKRLFILAFLTVGLFANPLYADAFLFACSGCLADEAGPANSIQQASSDGIGKFHMGREIAKVMGHEGIDWLERDTRENEEAPARGIAALDLKPDDVVADVGAGSGYHTFRMAPLVPKGRVVAVDIQIEMIAFLEARAKELGHANVQPHLGAIDGVQLPAESIDLALMVDAYHEFSHPAEMLQSLMSALRPGGRIVLLEYRAEDPNVPIKPLHKMSEAQIRKEFEAAGFVWKKTHDFLPWQHLVVFEKPR
jgi:SAM-dependent methyltransferase